MLQYLIKFSISLAVLYIFYRAVLRPLTFYQCNRFYLLGYSLLSFVIPFINITPWVVSSNNHQLINNIPAIGNYTLITDSRPVVQLSLLQSIAVTDWLLMAFCIGAVAVLVKLIVQYRSLRRIRQQAILLNSGSAIQLYETSAPVNPFSFGNAIYFNRQLHTEEELQRIIQHEFVHVKQRHTIDLLLGELLCIVNWFNPFAWLIRNSMRQNLEFIADHNVVANGLDKKEYQYLLLKVVGITQYSIASNFNFSNLKKRIAMMNKMKSAKLHLTKFLFVLPLLAVLLVAFRGHKADTKIATNEKTVMPNSSRGVLNDVDTLPPPPPPPPALANKKGYILTIADNEGECIVIVKNKQRKIVKVVTLEEWNKSKKENQINYGAIPPPPPPPPAMPGIPVAPVLPLVAAEIVEVHPAVPLNTDAGQRKQPSALALPGVVRLRNVNAGNPPLYIVDGKEMVPDYDLNKINPADIDQINVWKDEKAISKYGSKGSNGVIEIKTKKPSSVLADKPGSVVWTEGSKTLKLEEWKGVDKNGVGHSQNLPDNIVYFINGIKASKADIEKIDPVKIKSIKLLKGTDATDKYKSGGENGIIEITLKS